MAEGKVFKGIIEGGFWPEGTVYVLSSWSMESQILGLSRRM